MCKENLTGANAPPSQPGAKVVNQKEGGIIRIGDSIEAVVLKARDGNLRVVISAPRHLQVSAPKQ
ncbi:MAG: carbon storage regulator [Stenotrophomonas sp.]|uniref:carbon storage regulator n=1 Tax=Stenotrophomonas sp. TaxID=69392 RepID=UPI003D6C7420